MSDDFDRWHLVGIPGCIHEDDNDLSFEQEEGAACDCAEGNAAVDADE